MPAASYDLVLDGSRAEAGGIRAKLTAVLSEASYAAAAARIAQSLHIAGGTATAANEIQNWMSAVMGRTTEVNAGALGCLG
jgi:UDP:flavonoid glycosyltransferase YjiC (YdhE family)